MKRAYQIWKAHRRALGPPDGFAQRVMERIGQESVPVRLPESSDGWLRRCVRVAAIVLLALAMGLIRPALTNLLILLLPS